MKRFQLIRWSDKSGVSHVGHIASGVEFGDGACALRWKTKVKSTAFYDDWHDLMDIHGHGLKTVCYWLDDPPAAWERGRADCYQDRCENVPFASIGGLDARPEFRKPEYIPGHEELDYMHGYICRAIELYGLHWATDEFRWEHALTVDPGGGDEPQAERESTISAEEIERTIAKSLSQAGELRKRLERVFGRPPPNIVLRSAGPAVKEEDDGRKWKTMPPNSKRARRAVEGDREVAGRVDLTLAELDDDGTEQDFQAINNALKVLRGVALTQPPEGRDRLLKLADKADSALERMTQDEEGE